MAVEKHFAFDDTHGDRVEVKQVKNNFDVEIEFSYPDGVTAPMYFDRSHLEYFQNIVALLETICDHPNAETRNIPGSDEMYTGCPDCGESL